MQCLNLLLSKMRCYKLSPRYISHYDMISTWMSSVLASSEEKRRKSLASIFWNNVGIFFHILMHFKFCLMPLKAGNNEPIWHGWYPPHITVVDNTGEAWGTSSAIKGNDGVSTSPLYIFLWSYLPFFDFRLTKSLKNKQKWVLWYSNFES